MTNLTHVIDWSKWHVKHTTNEASDIDVRAMLSTPVKCLMMSCANGCVGHNVSTITQPDFVSHVYAGTQRQGEALSLIVRRGVKSRHGDFKSHQPRFTFKGQASRSFI